MRRRLRCFDILCLGVNGIIGSGIFLIPGRLLGEAGPASILLFPLVGLLFMTVGLCFAEAASRVDRNGGPYHYVRLAFGDTAGFAVGWIAVVTAIFSYAAVARGLPTYLDALLPGVGTGWMAHGISGGVIGLLGWLNIRGVTPGARVTDLFTVSKLLPLLLLLIAGALAFHPTSATFTPFAPHGLRPMFGLLLAVAFTYQGFEAVPVPAGETIAATRLVPKAILGSLGIALLIYTALQLVLVGSGAPLAGSAQPLADAAAALLGPRGRTIIAIGAVISMTGFCAGAALLSPRYLTVLCEDGFLPEIGARLHPRYATPHLAIGGISLLTFGLTLLLDFDRLVDISALAVVSQYLLTCLAIPRLRRRLPDDPTTYRAPGGLVMPLLGAGFSLVFLTQIHIGELGWGLAALGLGFALSIWSRHSRGATMRPAIALKKNRGL